MTTDNAGSNQMGLVYADSKNTKAAVVIGQASACDFYDLFCARGKYALQVGSGARVRLNVAAGTAVNIVTAGALVGNGALVSCKTTTLASTGAVEIAWASGAAASAWPAANTAVTDAIAATVVGSN